MRAESVVMVWLPSNMCSCSGHAMLCCRYTHLLRLIESTRDFEAQEQVDKADGYKAALLSNLGLVTFQQEEYARSIEWCDKVLQMDPDNAKVRLMIVFV